MYSSYVILVGIQTQRVWKDFPLSGANNPPEIEEMLNISVAEIF